MEARITTATIALGALLAGGCGPDRADVFPLDAPLQSPFSYETSGLPHRVLASSERDPGPDPGPDPAQARAIIEAVFAQAGYALVPSFPYERDGVAVVLDGFDPQRRVGYVFAHEGNLDEDAYVQWWASVSSEAREAHRLAQAERVLGFRWRQEIDAIRALDEPRARRERLGRLAHHLSAVLLSLEELRALDALDAGGDSIAVISRFDQRFRVDPEAPPLEAGSWDVALRIADPAQRERALRALDAELLARSPDEAQARLEDSVFEFVRWVETRRAGAAGGGD